MSVERVELPASSEVLAAWQDHFAKQEMGVDGLTVSELAKLAGLSDSRMRRRVREGVVNGTYVCVGKGVRRDASGMLQRPLVYQVKKK